MDRGKTLSSNRIFEGQVVNLRVDRVRLPDGHESTREVIEHSAAVAIIPIDTEDNILLVRQYRYAPEKELLEIPAGGIDGDETPEEAVRREMQEETGYLPGKVENLGGFYSTPGFCDEYLYLYLAAELTPGRLYAEDTEGITVIPTPLKDIPGLIESGSICDAKSIAGLLTYIQHRKNH